MHHNIPDCLGCAGKLKTAHPELVKFALAFRTDHPEGHISCSTRSQAEQEADYVKGVSKARWGESPHDFDPSRALDWFRLTQAGGASFDSTWYIAILNPAIIRAGLVWGGNFKSIKDLPHVELPDWKNR